MQIDTKPEVTNHVLNCKSSTNRIKFRNETNCNALWPKVFGLLNLYSNNNATKNSQRNM